MKIALFKDDKIYLQNDNVDFTTLDEISMKDSNAMVYFELRNAVTNKNVPYNRDTLKYITINYNQREKFTVADVAGKKTTSMKPVLQKKIKQCTEEDFKVSADGENIKDSDRYFICPSSPSEMVIEN